MPHERAYRRHKREVKLRRRYKIIKAVYVIWDAPLEPRLMHAHIRCSCLNYYPEERSRKKREWRSYESRAW